MTDDRYVEDSWTYRGHEVEFLQKDNGRAGNWLFIDGEDYTDEWWGHGYDNSLKEEIKDFIDENLCGPQLLRDYLEQTG